MLLNLIENVKFRRFKGNFFNFCSPLISYMSYVLNESIDVKFVLLLENGEINSNSLEVVLKNYLDDNGMTNLKLIKLNDGIEAMNFLYFDSIFFLKIKIIISELNLKFMNGDILFKTIKNLNKSPFDKIKSVLYINNEMKGGIDVNNGIKYYLNKPCSKNDLNVLFAN